MGYVKVKITSDLLMSLLGFNQPIQQHEIVAARVDPYKLGIVELTISGAGLPEMDANGNAKEATILNQRIDASFLLRE